MPIPESQIDGICDSGICMSGPSNKDCVNCLSMATTNGGCCDEARRCDPNVNWSTAHECLDLLSCYGGCTTQSCIEQCDVDHPDGKAMMDMLDSCKEASCVPPCVP